MCRASAQWARDHDYVAVLAYGVAHGLIEYARWAGHLPWTTYAKLGFKAIQVPSDQVDEVPGWAKGEVHEPIKSEVRNALASGRPIHDILERLMVLALK